MKRIVIAIDGGTAEQRDAVTKYIKDKEPRCGFWHWVVDLWLVVDTDPNAQAFPWREAIREIVGPGISFIVFEISGEVTSHGFSPEESHQWLTKSWQGPLPKPEP